MAKKIEIFIISAFFLSYLAPFYIYTAYENGKPVKVTKYGFQLFIEYPVAFILFILVIVSSILLRDHLSNKARVTILFLIFLYLTWVILSHNTNLSEIPIPIFFEFLKECLRGIAYGFYINLFLGISYFVYTLRKLGSIGG